MVKQYRVPILIGSGLVVLALVYRMYSDRMNKQKTGDQVARGLDALGASASGTGRAPLQVDPSVIEVLQQQVLDYQAQVEQLEEAVGQRDLKMAQMAAAAQPIGQYPGGMGSFPPPHMRDPALGAFPGDAPQNQSQVGQPGPGGMGMGGMGQLPSYQPGPGGMGAMPGPGGPAGMGGPVGSAQMGAFSSDPGFASSGNGGGQLGNIQLGQGGGGGQFTAF